MKYLLFFLVLPFSSLSNSDLLKGEYWESDSLVFKNVYEKFEETPSYLIKPNQNDVVFGLYDAEILGMYDLLKGSVKGWPLKYEDNSGVPLLVEQRYRDICSFGCFGDDASEQKLELSYELNPDNSLGCFGNHPLRYGDLDGDTTDEIVLFLGEDIVMFSPEQEAITFSQNLNVADWMSKEETSLWIIDFGKAGPLDDQHPQYQSSIVAFTSANYQSVQPAYRGYGKLYFGDFNSDGKRDIIVWRKIYESLLRGDSKEGFALKEDTYLHYEKPTSGIYELIGTPVDSVSNWLASRGLTWQKGYPSKSECEGQEGQLIPEMHDPLLNDPDVLK
jgi:hypothetical protein